LQAAMLVTCTFFTPLTVQWVSAAPATGPPVGPEDDEPHPAATRQLTNRHASNLSQNILSTLTLLG